MKATHNSLIILSLLTCSAPSQTGILSKATATISPIALYASIKILQADGDLSRARRLSRMDKDNAIDNFVEHLKKNESEFSHELIKIARRAQSSTTQRIEDKGLEHITPTIKELGETYQTAKNIVDDVIKKNAESKK